MSPADPCAGTDSAAGRCVLLDNNRPGNDAMLRGFTDSTGVEWRVWEVLPSTAENGREFLSMSSLQTTPFANGWLCFESTEQKRRLAPIPSGWESRDISVLEDLCSRATVVPLRPRARV